MIPLLVMSGFAQEKPASSLPHPPPRIAGRFIDTDGTRSLTLHYARNGQPERFIGFIQSTCMLRAGSKSGEGKPLDLTSIPAGTPMTVYYVPHRIGKKTENIILSMRFDRVRSGSPLPQGVNIPCFKGQPAH